MIHVRDDSSSGDQQSYKEAPLAKIGDPASWKFSGRVAQTTFCLVLLPRAIGRIVHPL